MFSTLFKIGPVAIHSYGLMIAIGFLLALHFIQRDAHARLGIDPEHINAMAFWSLFLGVAGTRVVHIMMFPSEYSWNDPVGWIAIWRGGLVFQGVFPLVLPYCWYAARHYKIPFWATADCVMPYLAMAHACGRFGCFMNGCCFGCRTSLPWGVSFPRVPWDLSTPATGSPAYVDHCIRFGLDEKTAHWSYPIQPTQLYGVAGLLGLCLLLLYLRKRWNPYPGFTFPLYFILYGIGRVFVEFLRDDHNPTVFGALSVQQVVSIAFVIVGVMMFFILRDYLKSQPTPAPDSPDTPAAATRKSTKKTGKRK